MFRGSAIKHDRLEKIYIFFCYQILKPKIFSSVCFFKPNAPFRFLLFIFGGRGLSIIDNIIKFIFFILGDQSI